MIPDNTSPMIGAARQEPLGTDDDGASPEWLRPLLVEYWLVVQRRSLVIAAAIVLALGAGLLITLLTPSVYTARILVQIDREQKRVTNVQGIDPETAARDAEFYATQYELLVARTIGERVARALKLAENDAFFAAHGATRPGAGAAAGGNRQAFEAAVKLLLANIKVTPVRNSRLVNVAYTSRDPGLSARVANAWGDEFIASNLDRQYSSTTEARRFLEERLRVLKSRLEQSERAAVEYASKQNIVRLEGGVDADGRTQAGRTLTEADLSSLNEELARATAARVEAQSTAGTARGSGPDSSLNTPELSVLRQRRDALQTEYAKLLVAFEPEYPAAREIKQQIDTVERLIRAEVRRAQRVRSDELAAAQARESELRQRVGSLKGQLQTQQQANIQYNIFQREADTNRQLYEAILQRYKEIGVAGSVGVNNISIVDKAEVPKSPSSPKMLQNMAIALLAGLALAVGIVLLLEQLDQGVKEPGQLKRELGLSVIGTVPLEEGEFNKELVDPKSAVYEAYFASASNLTLSTPEGFPRSLMVTSAEPAEGKSSTAIVLSIILGRLNKKVLLIDTDLRSPSLAGRFGIANEAGVSNVLVGEARWPQLVQQTRFSNVYLLPAGPKPLNPAELLSTERLKDIVSEALTSFDHVIVDAPPVLGLADAPLISRTVAATAFIVQSRGAPLQVIKQALGRLRMIRSPVIGGLITKVSARDMRYGYGKYGYGYGYGHDYGRTKQTGLLRRWQKRS